MTQAYDGSMKGLFFEEAAALIAYLLPGADVKEAVDTEVLRPPMRVDRVYRILYCGILCILHLEFQTNADEDMAHRLLVYHSILWREHKIPVITIVIYLFPATVPRSPLREVHGEKELLTFHFDVVCMWKLDARQHVKNHIMCLYPMLPTMGNVDDVLLLEAIDELLNHYKDDEAGLQRRLLWMDTFLRRAELDPQVIMKVRKRLDTLQHLLEQNEFVRQQREQGFAKGEVEGFAKGEVAGLQKAIIYVISRHYPALRELAQQIVPQIQSFEALNLLNASIALAPDEKIARAALLSSVQMLP